MIDPGRRIADWAWPTEQIWLTEQFWTFSFYKRLDTSSTPFPQGGDQSMAGSCLDSHRTGVMYSRRYLVKRDGIAPRSFL
jgi:hypothetical protein